MIQGRSIVEEWYIYNVHICAILLTSLPLPKHLGVWFFFFFLNTHELRPLSCVEHYSLKRDILFICQTSVCVVGIARVTIRKLQYNGCGSVICRQDNKDCLPIFLLLRRKKRPKPNRNPEDSVQQKWDFRERECFLLDKRTDFEKASPKWKNSLDSADLWSVSYFQQRRWTQAWCELVRTNFTRNDPAACGVWKIQRFKAR